jgi:hypothetical protein
MSYNARLLDDLLKCIICSQKLIDPRLLPCGTSICNSCVEHWQDVDSNYVQCQKCRMIHEIPEGGFPSNQAAISNLEPFNIEAAQITSELSHVHSQLESEAIVLEDCLGIGETTIRKKCDDIRNNVQLAIEETELQLFNLREKFSQEIDVYEKICKQNLARLSSDATVLAAITNAKELIENSSNIALNSNVDHQATLLSFCKRLLKQTERLNRQITNDIFDNKRINFFNIPTELELGSIEFSKRKRFFKNCSNYSTIDLNQFFQDMSIDWKPSFNILDQTLIVAYTDSESCVILCTLNLKTNEFKKKKTSYKSVTLETATLKNRIFVLMCPLVDYPHLTIASFDFKLPI